MGINFPTYSHPYRGKVVLIKGESGDTPTIEVTYNEDNVVISVTNPNDGHPITTTATIVKPKATVAQTSTGATLTVLDGDGTTTANIANGISIVTAEIDDNHHLIITLSNGDEVDAGEVPLNALEVAYTTTLDGTSNTITLPNDFDTSDISYLLINGSTLTDGWTISGNILTLPYPPGSVPSGKLEIVKNAAGFVTDGNMAALSTLEIYNILSAGESE